MPTSFLPHPKESYQVAIKLSTDHSGPCFPVASTYTGPTASGACESAAAEAKEPSDLLLFLPHKPLLKFFFFSQDDTLG